MIVRGRNTLSESSKMSDRVEISVTRKYVQYYEYLISSITKWHEDNKWATDRQLDMIIDKTKKEAQNNLKKYTRQLKTLEREYGNS